MATLTEEPTSKSVCLQQPSPLKWETLLLKLSFEATKPIFIKTMTIYCKLKLLLERITAMRLGFVILLAEDSSTIIKYVVFLESKALTWPCIKHGSSITINK